MPTSRIDERLAFAGAARSGRLVAELDETDPAARETAAFAREVEGLRAMIAGASKRGFCARPKDPDAWVCAPEPSPRRLSCVDFSARLVIEASPTLRGRIKVAVFQRRTTVVHWPRTLLGREFSGKGGATS